MPDHSLTALLLLQLACQVSAQEPSSTLLPDQPSYFGLCYFESPEDSLKFMRFYEGLVFYKEANRINTTSLVIRQTWRESQGGGLRIVSRGDGSTLFQTSASILVAPMLHATYFRTGAGKRGLVIAWETLSALICRTASYFVEE